MSSDTKKSFETLSAVFERGMLDFLWMHWSTLGVFGSVPKRTKRCIDPETLLLLTTEIGRHDARLFDEVLDWLVANSRWINTQRLRSLHTKQAIGDARVLASVAATMSKTDPATKWRRLADLPAAENSEALFRHGRNALSAEPENPDPCFLRYGLVRAPIHHRNMSQSVPVFEPAALMLRLRALFGVGMRPDILTCLIIRGDSYAANMSEVLGYSRKRVQDTLLEMYGSGLVQIRSEGHKRIYGVDAGVWKRFLDLGARAKPHWVSWCPLARGVTSIWRELLGTDAWEEVEPYVASSRLRSALELTGEDLQLSGIGWDFEDSRGYSTDDEYTRLLSRSIQGLVDCLLED